MIEVRIRTEDEDTGRRLCDWPAEQLDSLIPAIGKWCVVCDEGTYWTEALSGQIRIEGFSAYFEIIVNFPDE